MARLATLPALFETELLLRLTQGLFAYKLWSNSCTSLSNKRMKFMRLLEGN